MRVIPGQIGEASMRRSSGVLQQINEQHTTMKSIITFLFTLLLTSAAIAQGYDPRRTISISGEGEIKVAPNEVIINFAVETNNDDLDAARAENDKKVSAVIALCKKLGVEEKHIQTDYLTVEPRYDHYVDNNRSQRKFLGYYMTKNITVSLRCLEV